MDRIKTNDIEREVQQWAGESPKKGLNWTGKWGSPFGKNNKFRFFGDPSHNWGMVRDWSGEKEDTLFYSGKTKFNFKTINIPPLKNIQAEYDKLSDLVDHSYLKEKGIKAVKGIKEKGGELIVPIMNINDIIISWQRIFWNQKDNKFDKKFKFDCPLSAGHHFPIGPETDKIHVAEGYATAYSIHEITGRQVYCAFSIKNLDNVARFLRKKYPTKQIILNPDNDKDRTHKTKIKDKNLIVLCPSKEGDFNDHRENIFEQNKLISLQSGLVKSISHLKRKVVKHLDQADMILSSELMTLSGPKGSLKSSGSISYLLEQGLKIGYFSDNENDENVVNSFALNYSKDQLVWINFNELDRKHFWEHLEFELTAHKIDIVQEDPCFETLDFNNQITLRRVLGKRVELARKAKVGWLMTRNFSKNEAKLLINRVGGFGLWSSIPRAVMFSFKADQESKTYADFAGQDNQVKAISLLQTHTVNLGPTPKQSVVMKLKTHDQKVFFEFENTPRVEHPEKWGKKQTKKEQNAKQDRHLMILGYLQEKPLISGDLKLKMVSQGFNEETIKKDIKSLKTRKFISGGGSGPQSKPLKITDAGRGALNE